MIHESYDWIVNCIYSCRNDFHIKCCQKLIKLFEKQFEDEIICQSLADNLQDDLQSQYTYLCVEV